MAAVDAPILTVEEQQEKWLAEASSAVRMHAEKMQEAIEARTLSDVLKHAWSMLAELRTSQLSPQNYYELYIIVFDELQALEAYFRSEIEENDRSVEELYEIVQHAGYIVPRLYLLVTVGSVYIQSKGAPAKDILKDLVEMCKGVQHPTRGLFLRHYLSTVTKNKLPDVGNRYEEDGGTVQNSVDFVLQNFKEMVWLWVRMEHKQIVSDPERRAKEREALRLLVGFNLTRLGSLDGVDLEMYSECVMPRVIDIICNSGDTIAQQYLSEVMIQVFPDEFHLAKLDDTLTNFCTQLTPGVNLQSLLTSLMDRLANYAVESTAEGVQPKKKWEKKAIAGMYESFQNAVNNLMSNQPDALDDQKYSSVMLSLLKLVLQAYPDRSDRVDELFNFAASCLADKVLDNKSVNLVKKMLILPVEHYGNMSSVLDLNGWPVLLDVLKFEQRLEVSRELCKAALKAGTPIDNVEHVTKVFEFIKPLLEDPADPEKMPESDPSDFEEDQTLVAKLVHLFKAPEGELDVQFKIYSVARKQFGKGGELRMKYTFPPLIFNFTRLAIVVKKALDGGAELGKVSVEKILQYTKQLLAVLCTHYPKLAFNSYTHAARVADKCGCVEDTIEMLDCAFVLFEEEIMANSKDEMLTLPTLISCITSMKKLGDDAFEKFSKKLCSYSANLLKKEDACAAAFMCSHLFHKASQEEQRKKVLDCLQRSLKVVDNCKPQRPLFVDILNSYMYFFTNANEHITVNHINVLWALTRDKMAEDEGGVSDTGFAKVTTYYQNTVDYVQAKQVAGDEGARWNEIDAS
eukprot:TRINITY_DN22393_c0_g1_i1.p1 TRINITY_DN22393_c0_g1~~TRINITY_DN22393_c0_g1_i1.p1  ORF type:complete len:799 (+),score=374.44 TRINITY_DN22393_c0_g1_i1:47-2443(+)